MKCHTATIMGIILVPTRLLECMVLRIVCRLSKRSSKISNFSKKGTQRHDCCAAIDTCYRLVNVYQTHHQPSAISSETYQKIEGSVKPINETRCMKSDLNGGVRSMSIN
jgi:hypothetical protein